MYVCVCVCVTVPASSGVTTVVVSEVRVVVDVLMSNRFGGEARFWVCLEGLLQDRTGSVNLSKLHQLLSTFEQLQLNRGVLELSLLIHHCTTAHSHHFGVEEPRAELVQQLLAQLATKGLDDVGEFKKQTID